MIDLETLLILICEALEMRPEQIKSKSQRTDLCDARSIFIFWAHREMYDRQEIVDAVGLTSKSAVNYHVKRVKDLVISDKTMRETYAKCSERIRAYKERDKAACR